MKVYSHITSFSFREWLGVRKQKDITFYPRAAVTAPFSCPDGYLATVWTRICLFFFKFFFLRKKNEIELCPFILFINFLATSTYLTPPIFLVFLCPSFLDIIHLFPTPKPDLFCMTLSVSVNSSNLSCTRLSRPLPLANTLAPDQTHRHTDTNDTNGHRR